ncbi:hypothetical protein MNBD_GAMMA09-2247 [hydrothermal vent metagenome]|uniref:Lipoprotein n=1 Tax=hydrothermal vent metagenome TaxID=652676 RepID=A0A3B0XJ88_9ZZZZ
MIIKPIRWSFFIKLISLALVIAASGCNQGSYKNISDNPDVYFKENYTLNELPRQVKHKIKVFNRGKAIKPDAVELELDITRTDMETMSVIKTHSIKKIEKLGLGVVRSIERRTKDGGLYARVMDISYNGIMELKKETFKNNKKIHSHFHEVRTIDKISFDISNMDVNKIYKIVYQAGRKIDEYNYEKYEVECARKNKINANFLNSTITGNAIGIMCKYYFKGEIYSTVKYWYIDSYGISIVNEIDDFGSITTYRVRSFTPIL